MAGQDDAARILLNKLQRYPSHIVREWISSELARTMPQSSLNPDYFNLNGLIYDGHLLFRNYFNNEDVAKNTDYFKRIKSYDGHVPNAGSRILKFFDQHTGDYSSYTMLESINSPSLLQAALDTKLLSIVDAYFGCEAKIYSINTFWTYASSHQSLTHGFHRDADDYKFMTFFVYWTDIARGDGEQYIIANTHNEAIAAPLLNKIKLFLRTGRIRTNAMLSMPKKDGYDLNNNDYEVLFGDRVKVIEADAGALAIALTRGYHRGSSVLRNRLVSWIRFGYYENEAYTNDGTKRLKMEHVAGEHHPLISSNKRRLSLIVE